MRRRAHLSGCPCAPWRTGVSRELIYCVHRHTKKGRQWIPGRGCNLAETGLRVTTSMLVSKNLNHLHTWERELAPKWSFCYGSTVSVNITLFLRSFPFLVPRSVYREQFPTCSHWPLLQIISVSGSGNSFGVATINCDTSKHLVSLAGGELLKCVRLRWGISWRTWIFISAFSIQVACV